MIRVVLADDENKVVLLLQHLIDWEAMGFEIVGIANDGLRALELVNEKQPQLLITDIRMPGCDGIKLIRRAKELQPSLCFIVISGYRQFEYAQSALKYGVEDYLLKPIRQDELSSILLRLKNKLGKESALEYQLKKSGEQRQRLFLSALIDTAERKIPFLSSEQVAEEYGLHFVEGCYFAAIIKPDISGAEQYPDGYGLMLKHTLEIVRREISTLTGTYAAAIQRESVAAMLYLQSYPTIEVKQCFTKIRAEVEKQRDLFWDIHCTICLGSRQGSPEQLSVSMREALWLCQDRMCQEQRWRDAETEKPDYSQRYQMDTAQKKRIQEAVEYLDGERFDQELSDSYRRILQKEWCSGQTLESWFHQILEVSLYGMQQIGDVDTRFAETMERNFLRCANEQDVFRLLQQSIRNELQRLDKEKSQREARPITEAKRYIQQHYQEALRLEDVSNAAGFNATYFSALFKKETGQNFLDYLTELRMNKAKELLCSDTLPVQNVAELVGYRDLKYFSRLFKKTTGVSPSDYKKLYR